MPPEQKVIIIASLVGSVRLPNSHYGRSFYESETSSASSSAQEVIPIVQRLFQPRSVVDLGCGTGSWLAQFERHGVEDVLGIDGDWVDPKTLQIDSKKFLLADLSKPLRLRKRFDLVICLEVAEHLPLNCADTLIDSLVLLGPKVLFSAAIPYQGGTGHLNEQWQDYWISKFRKRGLKVLDCIRPQIWGNRRISSYYRQNILVFAEEDTLMNGHDSTSWRQGMFSVVHPDYYLRFYDPKKFPANNFKVALAAVPWIMARGVRQLLEK